MPPHSSISPPVSAVAWNAATFRATASMVPRGTFPSASNLFSIRSRGSLFITTA